MNTFLNEMKQDANYTITENGALAHKSTMRAVYDMFALGAAYRTRSDDDCILLFKNAYEEDPELALKCLFYIGDCRGGQGERRYFRVCFNWLAKKQTAVARKNMKLIPAYRRWDDLLYSCLNTPLQDEALAFLKEQFTLDVNSKTPSLLAKWLPSENASSATTRAAGSVVRTTFGMTHKEYRKALSYLRSKINIVEKLMSENRWDEIDFSKIPSKAGLIYKNAFARRDIIAKKYETFANDETTKVNAEQLYPYEIVSKVVNAGRYYSDELSLTETDRAMLEKYWTNQKDYFDGKQSNILCVVDTSGSMVNSKASAPINIAISLGMYCAERAGGPFKDYYISFSSKPQLIKVEGVDFADKVQRIYKTNLCENTDLVKTFDMLLDIADRPETKEEDIPDTICVISDMEIDHMSGGGRWCSENHWTTKNTETEMEKVRRKWAEHGHKMPRLIYWNVEARSNTILDSGDSVSFVSGASPVLFESVLTGRNGWDLCLDKLQSERYKDITI